VYFSRMVFALSTIPNRTLSRDDELFECTEFDEVNWERLERHMPESLWVTRYICTGPTRGIEASSTPTTHRKLRFDHDEELGNCRLVPGSHLNSRWPDGGPRTLGLSAASIHPASPDLEAMSSRVNLTLT
jgi:hypothetical protein